MGYIKGGGVSHPWALVRWGTSPSLGMISMESHVLGTGSTGWGEGLLVIPNIHLSREPLAKARACTGHVHFPGEHSKLPCSND